MRNQLFLASVLATCSCTFSTTVTTAPETDAGFEAPFRCGPSGNLSMRACPGGIETGECESGFQFCRAVAPDEFDWGPCEGLVSPATEVCDGLDNNCDGRLDENLAGCFPPVPPCDPTAVELCDHRDNNCNGSVDEGCECATGDRHACGSGVGECTPGEQRCIGGFWSSCSGVDRDTELCDGRDNDCDGQVDNGCACRNGDVIPCGSAVGECTEDTQVCVDGQWSRCGGVSPDTDICDGLDNNCDGHVDEDCRCEPGVTQACRTDLSGACAWGIQACDRLGRWSSCADSPDPVPEFCYDGLDNDCDGRVDNGCTCRVGTDITCTSPDRRGICAPGLVRCLDDGSGYTGVCEQIVDSRLEDCGPFGTGNGADEDCDGATDEGCECTPGMTHSCVTALHGECHFGTETCDAANHWGVCVPPPAVREVCNDGLDNDCSGLVDNGCHCVPGDIVACNTDSFGQCRDGSMVCTDDGEGYTPCLTIFGPAREICRDGLDNDCDGAVDNGCRCTPGSTIPCTVDSLDGVCSAGDMICLGDGSGYSGVCEQRVAAALEDCGPDGTGNGLDEDCDGETDEGCDCTPGMLRACAAGGLGDCVYGTELCGADNQWGVCFSSGPAAEFCGDGRDNDCNGAVDNGCRCTPGDALICVIPTRHGVCDVGRTFCLPDGSGYNGVCEPLVASSPETCGPLGTGNGADEDCDGETDEGCECTPGATQSCRTELPGNCYLGTQTCSAANQWGVCVPPLAVREVCNDGLDNDCSGEVDNGCRCTPGSVTLCVSGLPGDCSDGLATCAPDGEGYGPCVNSTLPAPEFCGDGGDNDCDGVVDNGCACDPFDPPIPCTSPDRRGVCAPGTMRCQDDGSGYTGVCEPAASPSLEDCGPGGLGNGLDEDCDGETDEICRCVPGSTRSCVTIFPGDCRVGTETCAADRSWGACLPPDSNPETCGDGRDNDCDNRVDNGCACDPAALPIPCVSARAGICAPGIMRCLDDGSGYTGVCEPTVSPSLEDCGLGGLGNGLDEDCDGETDEICRCVPGSTRSCVTIFSGDCRIGTETCAADRSWGACLPPDSNPETCGDGRDNDCDGRVDNGCSCAPGTTTLCVSDLPGDCSLGTAVCFGDGNGYGPCVNLFSQAPEICRDGRDNDCNGAVDNGCRCTPGTTIPCTSPDRRGVCAPGTMRCLGDGSGYASICEPAAVPTLEDCGPLGTGNGADEDCDGETDEGCECRPGATRACLTFFPGDCRTGTETCAADNRWGACLPPDPAPEICGDGNDNDCSGIVDDHCACVPGSTIECPTFLPGICNRGIATCNLDSNGYGPCVPTTFGPPEVCGDGLDNDCNGRTDEVCRCMPGSTVSCFTGGTGQCAEGRMTCDGDGMGYGPCVPLRFPAAEVCGNGLDEDCDFMQDESPPCP